MKHIVFPFLIFSLTLLQGCNGGINNRLEQALVLADDNRAELEKVLNRYSTKPADSLKYRAACFLIENMPGYHYYEGEELDKHSIYFKLLAESDRNPKEILDSLGVVYGDFNIGNLKIKHDIHEIDSAYLCENIDLAFEVWQKQPWGKNISFHDFCEYILPYRIGNEKLTNWRKEYLELYGSFVDSLSNEDPVSAAKVFREKIIKTMNAPRFTLTRPNGYPLLDAETAKNLTGNCGDISQFILLAFRSAGIPCTMDYMPMRGDTNYSHTWISLKNHKNEYYVMDLLDEIVYVSETISNRTILKSKVYRTTFSHNTKSINQLSKFIENIPPQFSFLNYRFYDVTELYSNSFMKLTIPGSLLYTHEKKNQLVFLCAPAWLQWVPVDWCKSRKNKPLTFDIDAGCVLRLATFENGKLDFITDPFFVNKQTKDLEIYKPEDRGSVTLFSKFSIEKEYNFRKRMVGGVFEGSSHPDFRFPDTLHTIKEIPSRLFTRVPITSQKKYRYVRYKGPAQSHCNISEVQFYSDSVYLTGTILGTSGSWQNSGTHEYTNVFDGLTETSFDHDTPSEGWAGLDLGMPFTINEIIYSPRNRDNYIEIGQDYELFTSEQEGWKSLGRQTSSSDSLYYDNVPIGTLYFLRNHSSGNEERVFVMEGNTQVFR